MNTIFEGFSYKSASVVRWHTDKDGETYVLLGESIKKDGKATVLGGKIEPCDKLVASATASREYHEETLATSYVSPKKLRTCPSVYCVCGKQVVFFLKTDASELEKLVQDYTNAVSKFADKTETKGVKPKIEHRALTWTHIDMIYNRDPGIDGFVCDLFQEIGRDLLEQNILCTEHTQT